MILVLSAKKLPGYSVMFSALYKLNIRFLHGDIGSEIAFVIDVDGMRLETYRQIMSICQPFQPIDITKEAECYQHIIRRSA
jgi:hypothetical protein